MAATVAKSDNDNKAAKKARKAALKAEADKLGISYDELKKQKKQSKKREAAQLTPDPIHQTEMKRMRTWSKDFDDEDDPTLSKKRRTRSMDAKDDATEEETTAPTLSPEEWRREHGIKVQGHGANRNTTGEDPFLKFTDAPFGPAIQRMFQQVGFDAPTHIQSQVCMLYCCACVLFWFA